MVIDFTRMNKTERGDYINSIWSINQLIKHTFSSIYLYKDGKIIGDKLNKLENGRHYGITELQKFIHVPFKDSCLRIDCERIYKVIKDYKKLIDGILYNLEDYYVYFIMKDMENIKFAKIVEPIDISDYDFTDISNSKSTFNTNEIDYLVDKNILTKTLYNRYSMILSHKLFPNMKKSSENKILINDIDDRYFTSRFVFEYDATNQSGKKLYSTVKLFHMYKFLKI